MNGGNVMKKSIGLCMLLVSLILCSQTVSADVVWGPPILQSDFVQAIGLAPFLILVVVVTAIIIIKIKNKK